MYGAFLKLDPSGGAAQRIFDPFSYRATLNERFVPVCAEEAFNLCGRYPIVWQRNQRGDLQLVAIRSLRESGEVPRVRMMALSTLPLLLQAYPFRFEDVAAQNYNVGLDMVAPSRERDQGSYVHDARGEVLPGAELKLTALERFARFHQVDQLLRDALQEGDAMEPVTLPENLVTEHALPEFVTAIASPDDARLLGAIPREAHVMALRFLAAQRLSLFTMTGIIASSEAAG